MQDFAGFVEALHVEEGDAGVEAADVGLRVENAGALEFAQGFFELLAIHEGDAEIVFTDYVGARVFGCSWGVESSSFLLACGAGVGVCVMRCLLQLRLLLVWLLRVALGWLR